MRYDNKLTKYDYDDVCSYILLKKGKFLAAFRAKPTLEKLRKVLNSHLYWKMDVQNLLDTGSMEHNGSLYTLSSYKLLAP